LYPYGFDSNCSRGSPYIVDFGHGNGRPLLLLIRGLSIPGVGFEITPHTFTFSKDLLKFYQEANQMNTLSDVVKDNEETIKLETYVKLYHGNFATWAPKILGNRTQNLVIAYSFSEGMCPNDMVAMCDIFNNSYGLRFIVIDCDWNDLTNYGLDHIFLKESFQINNCPLVGGSHRTLRIYHVLHKYKCNYDFNHNILVNSLDNSLESSLFPTQSKEEKDLYIKYFDDCLCPKYSVGKKENKQRNMINDTNDIDDDNEDKDNGGIDDNLNESDRMAVVKDNFDDDSVTDKESYSGSKDDGDGDRDFKLEDEEEVIYSGTSNNPRNKNLPIEIDDTKGLKIGNIEYNIEIRYSFNQFCDHIKQSMIDLDGDDSYNAICVFYNQKINSVKKDTLFFTDPGKKEHGENFIACGIAEQKLNSLMPGNWLNCGVIDCYSRFLQHAVNVQFKFFGGSKIFIATTNFFQVFEGADGYTGIHNELRHLNLFTFNQLFFPYNVCSSHWVYIKVDLRLKKIYYRCSCKLVMLKSKKANKIVSKIKNFLNSHAIALKEVVGSMTYPSMQAIINELHFSEMMSAQQENGFDCGVYVLGLMQLECFGMEPNNDNFPPFMANNLRRCIYCILIHNKMPCINGLILPTGL